MKNFGVAVVIYVSQFLGACANHSFIFGTVAALQRHLPADCIYFIQFNDDENQGLEQQRDLTLLQKYFSYRGSSVMAPYYHKFDEETAIGARKQTRPLNIILPHFKDAHYLFTKLRCLFSERWLLFLHPDVHLEKYFSDTYIPFNCEFLVAQIRDDRVDINEIYRVAADRPLEIVSFGSWFPKYDMDTFTTETFQTRRRSLNGHVLQAFSIQFPPFTTVTDQDGRRVMGGGFGEVWKDIQLLGNFTSNVTKLSGVTFGIKTENGTWSGMVGMLEKGQADLIVAAFSMTSARTYVLTYTPPILYTKYCLLIGQSTKTIHLENFLSPLSSKLWLAVLCSIFLYSIVFATSYHTANKFSDKNEPKPTLYAIFFDIASTYCMQGGIITSNIWSCRLIQVTAYAAAVTVFAAYSGSLISYLATQKEQLPFNSFKELLKNGMYKVGVREGTAEFSNLNEANNDIMSQMYQKLLLPDPGNIVADYEEAINRMCAMKYAFWGPVEPTLQLAEEMLTCKIHVVHGCCTGTSLAIPLMKDSPYYFLIRNHVKALMFNGVLSKVKQSITPPTNGELEEQHVSLEVDFKDVAPLLLILLIGMTAATILLIFERNSNLQRKLSTSRKINGWATVNTRPKTDNNYHKAISEFGEDTTMYNT